MNSKWSGYATKRQHGVGITIKVENGIEGIEIQEVIQVSPRIITANILLVVVPYELYAVTRYLLCSMVQLISTREHLLTMVMTMVFDFINSSTNIAYPY